MIECRNIIKDFGSQRVLHDLSFKIQTGEFVSISGRSGSGKSTLLYIISTLDQPTTGSVYFNEESVYDWKQDHIHRFRNERVGFIFQFHYLLPELTALENILLPARNLGLIQQKEEKAIGLMNELGITEQAHKLPSQMSGGQQQRVAIARALIMDPAYIFADEPTGNLDSYNANVVMELLKKINREKKTTICLVTHDPDFAKMAQREIFLIDGRMSPVEK